MTAPAERPVPRPTRLTAPFWDGCRAGTLLVQQCERCAEFVFIPQHFCPACRGRVLTWVQSRGVGRVVSYTVIGRAQTPAFETPYVVAIVRLDEGYEMVTNIVDTTPDRVHIGARVQVRFVPVSPTVTLPCFALTA